MDANLKFKLENMAKLFRQTIGNMELNEFPQSDFFDRFPRGCCSDTSDLLLKYYLDHGIETEYVWGINNSGQSHRWLEYKNELVIDITADQFECINEAVLITTDKSWHSMFLWQKRGTDSFDEYNPYNRLRLQSIYRNILKRINSSTNDV